MNASKMAYTRAPLSIKTCSHQCSLTTPGGAYQTSKCRYRSARSGRQLAKISALRPDRAAHHSKFKMAEENVR